MPQANDHIHPHPSDPLPVTAPPAAPFIDEPCASGQRKRYLASLQGGSAGTVEGATV